VGRDDAGEEWEKVKNRRGDLGRRSGRTERVVSARDGMARQGEGLGVSRYSG
jgi:hypothetical protein